ncbi:hypothetical protein ASF61_20660 [Duganella sp. Leaf126]|nr:hypothetical protein ASF61_20660 [Duganella sp. Leaf126]
MVLLLSVQSTSAAPLFNGRNLDNWTLETTPAASIEQVVRVLPEGVIAVAGQPSGFLATTNSYANYRLHVAWRWTGKPGNAGVLLHISDGAKDRVWPLSLQVQTKHGRAGDLLPMAGAAFSEPLTSAPDAVPRTKDKMAADSERPAGQWNVADIVARDGTVEVSINGVLQNRVTGVQPAAGRIGFQLEGAPYELRDVDVVELVAPVDPTGPHRAR